MILFAAYILYFVKKILLLNEYNAGSDNLKATLENLHKRLNTYLTFYERSYAILYPVYFCLGLIFGLLETGADHFLHRFEDMGYSAWFVVFTVVFFVVIYLLTNWYLRKLYGDHIEKLRELLHELQ